MSWDIVTLSEVTDSITDGDHQPAPKSDTGVWFIKIKDIKNNQISLENALHVPLEYYKRIPAIKKAVNGDVLYTVVGSYGIPVFVDTDYDFCFERNIALLRPNARIEPRYLYYAMKNPMFFEQAKQIANGSAQKLIPLSKLGNMTIVLPPLQIQKTIVETLSGYDKLISNNQKQIKLLEEAAQRLYKEWFVDLRFPGHETTKITDGIPEGWRKVTVTDLLEIKYGKDHKALENGTIPVYGSGGVMRKVKHILYSGESVLIPRKGSLNNIMLVSGDFWTIDTIFYSVPKIENTAKYAFHFLQGLDMYSFNIGAAVPSMTVKILEGISLMLPTSEVLLMFENQLSAYYRRLSILNQQIEMLSAARDTILPKLVNGEIII